MMNYADLVKRLEARETLYKEIASDHGGDKAALYLEVADDFGASAAAISTLTQKLEEAREVKLRDYRTILAWADKHAAQTRAMQNAAIHIRTAIGSLDDPTGPHIIEDVRRVRDVVLLDALTALSPPDISRADAAEDATTTPADSPSPDMPRQEER